MKTEPCLSNQIPETEGGIVVFEDLHRKALLFFSIKINGSDSNIPLDEEEIINPKMSVKIFMLVPSVDLSGTYFHIRQDHKKRLSKLVEEFDKAWILQEIGIVKFYGDMDVKYIKGRLRFWNKACILLIISEL